MKESRQALDLEAWLPIGPANRRPPLPIFTVPSRLPANRIARRCQFHDPRETTMQYRLHECEEKPSRERAAGACSSVSCLGATSSQRALFRNQSFDASAPQRMISGVSTIGTRCMRATFRQCTQSQGPPGASLASWRRDVGWVRHLPSLARFGDSKEGTRSGRGASIKALGVS